jgi:hypothetical protein
MAIYHKKGTLTPGSSTLAHDVRRAWKGEFDLAIAAGKTNWSVIEHDFVASGASTQRTVISNSLGFVFVITTSTTSSTTTINTWLGGSYTSPTISNFGMGYVGGTLVASHSTDSNGLSTTTFNPTVIVTTTASPHNQHHYFTATGSQDSYTAHIENDYAILSFKDSGTTARWLYIGQFTSLIGNTAINDDKPFALVTSSTNNNLWLGAAFLQSAGNVSTSIGPTNLLPGGAAWSGEWDGSPANSQFIDKYSSEPTKANVSPIYLTRATTDINNLISTSGATAHGWLTGKLKGVYHAGSSAAVYGDTISVDGNTYMYVGGVGYNVFASPAASLAGWALIS